VIRIANPDAIGPALRDLRTLYRLTQVQLATDAGVCNSQISHWERGERHPDLVSLARVIAALGYDLALVPVIETAPADGPSARVADDHPPGGVSGRTEGVEAISGAAEGDRDPDMGAMIAMQSWDAHERNEEQP
jgi:transcriptional regulator with XRE-family HTH domain